jgi:hypothetical protein
MHIDHPGGPPEIRARFTLPVFHETWPDDLWNSGTLIYSLREPDLSLPAHPPASDRILRFNSRFESGNLLSAYSLGNDAYHLILEYDPNPNRTCQWFYFQMTNVRCNIRYHFYISGFHKINSVFGTGSTVFVYSRKNATRNNIAWYRSGSGYAYGSTGDLPNATRATLQFQMHFPFDNDTVYLAYAIPYTYSNLTRDIAKWRASNPNLVTVQSLCHTVGGRSCPLLTIDSNPDDKSKKCIFLTGRIHPGETPSSLVLNGLINFLLSDSPLSQYLAEHFVIMIVPMMCIDGVIEGHYRCSLGGFDLNRVWDDPGIFQHPEVWHTKSLLREMVRERGVAAYLDFHGHSGQHGSFAYGCPLAGDREKVFPKMASFLSEDFCWEGCRFSFPSARKATGRVVARTELGIEETFTIESSFGGIPDGMLKNVLYDLKLWTELGARLAEALYHLVVEVPTPLRDYAQSSLIREADEPFQKVAVKRWPLVTVRPRGETNRAVQGSIPKKRPVRVHKVVPRRSVRVKFV